MQKIDQFIVLQKSDIMNSDFHEKPFDEGTIAKLEMFQLYAREWLPVFLSSIKPIWPEVHIFDFFCGPGQDVNGVVGSPVRIVEEVMKCKHRLAEGNIKLYFHFSDADSDKTEALRAHLKPVSYTHLTLPTNREV